MIDGNIANGPDCMSEDEQRHWEERAEAAGEIGAIRSALNLAGIPHELEQRLRFAARTCPYLQAAIAKTTSPRVAAHAFAEVLLALSSDYERVLGLATERAALQVTPILVIKEPSAGKD